MNENMGHTSSSSVFRRSGSTSAIICWYGKFILDGVRFLWESRPLYVPVNIGHELSVDNASSTKRWGWASFWAGGWDHTYIFIWTRFNRYFCQLLPCNEFAWSAIGGLSCKFERPVEFAFRDEENRIVCENAAAQLFNFLCNFVFLVFPDRGKLTKYFLNGRQAYRYRWYYICTD